LPKGLNGYSCECDDGWSGPNCDDKFALGGWISGIVVLAVLVIVASGVAFIYFRRLVHSKLNFKLFFALLSKV
jgi:hypothetical protein